MLRKVLVSSLILLYSLSVIGVPLHFHYCRGELKHVSLVVRKGCQGEDMHKVMARDCCKKTKPQCTKGKCCNDATEWAQENIPAVVQKLVFKAPMTLRSAEQVAESHLTEYTYQQPAPRDMEALAESPPLYLLKCSLIYYG